ncbi:MAG TPA: glycine cleavage system protein GcvH [Candidatus Avipropionibacterium avicola]|uniref:Glycine cleavage system H protein n=1 Tax=Candidatus Avipropionibacterium avicola TaxID=2840701 RepID=A0A9D1KLE6_9ACTN|nr:glycine cleavage system protein GcvH [Candidatus Avipropionibacterium avicola]
MSTLPENLRYSEDHEWVETRGDDLVRIGITAYAAEQLGDIVYVDLPEEGQATTAGEACGELESTKNVSELICPVAGVVTAVNPAVADDPGLVNTDPYGEGWLVEIRATDGAAGEHLMDAAAYAAHTG